MHIKESITAINTLIEDLSTNSYKWSDGDWLSKKAMELAIHNSTLGSFVADYEKKDLVAEHTYKTAREKVKLEVMQGVNKDYKDSKSATYADTVKQIATAEESLEYMKAHHTYRTLSYKRMSINSLIDAIRSRLSWIKSEMEKGNLQT